MPTTDAPRRIAYRVLTPRLEVRCYAPADATALVEAMAAGTAHIAPWIPFGREPPQSVDEKMELLRMFRGKFDLGQDFIFGAFDRTEPSRLVGGTGLHPRIGPDALEIGYWLRDGASGRGLATEMAAAMTRVGFRSHAVARLEIRCDSRNVASARIPEKLGYRREGCLRGTCIGSDPGPGDMLVFGMLRDEFDASPAAAVPVEAFDAAGRSIGL
ncbi:MAG: GNAT family N-acetyltransferase [Planctomycetes bacterium]|nr:GNAT family N-acetyltransferase [Planctomycetota bacterium]